MTGTPCAEGLFLNSAPKSGTVLLARILRAFIDPAYWITEPWLIAGVIRDPAFDDLRHKYVVGHAVLRPAVWAKFGGMRQILLLRDPVDCVLSYAKFFASEKMADRSAVGDWIRTHRPPREAVLHWLCHGWDLPTGHFPPVVREWMEIAAWAQLPGVMLVDYRELPDFRRHPEQMRSRLAGLLAHGGIDLDDFPDWRERLAEATDPARSGTWSENLSPTVDWPDSAKADADYVRARCGDAVRLYEMLRKQADGVEPLRRTV